MFDDPRQLNAFINDAGKERLYPDSDEAYFSAPDIDQIILESVSEIIREIVINIHDDPDNPSDSALEYALVLILSKIDNLHACRMIKKTLGYQS